MTEFTTPSVIESINKYTYHWEDYDIKVIADRLTDEGKAELWFYHSNGHGDSLLHLTQVNLLATTTMSSLKKRMDSHQPELPWQQILTYITKDTMERMRKGEAPVILDPAEGKIAHPGYYIEPIIMKGVPSVIFGDKGLNKTTISLMLLMQIRAGNSVYTDDSPSGLLATEEARVGILDWESNEALTNYTLSRLVKGNSAPYVDIPYLRCKQSLSDDIQRIANFIQDNKIQVVLIDSLGQAAGSDKYDTAGKTSALKFFECLRQLNVASLIIAQNAKGEEGKKTIYGSTYYTYYSRNIFELKKSQKTINQNDLHVALVHTESNYSKRYDPIGFSINYTDDSITVRRESVTLDQLKDTMSDRDAIISYFESYPGLHSAEDIANGVGKPQPQVQVVLSSLKKNGVLVNPSRSNWGLAAKISPDY